MNRNEIKEELKRLEGVYHTFGWSEKFMYDSVEYLLAKLEIAEKALEGANNKLGQISSKDFTNGELRYEAATIIQESLKAIRE